MPKLLGYLPLRGTLAASLKISGPWYSKLNPGEISLSSTVLGIRLPDNALNCPWTGCLKQMVWIWLLGLILCVMLARGKCGIRKIWTAVYSGWQGRKLKALISTLRVLFKPWHDVSKDYLSLKITIKDKKKANKSSRNQFSKILRLIR